MLEILFVIFVVVGFFAFLASVLPPPPPPRLKWPWFAVVGWFCWSIASVIWAFTTLNLHAVSVHIGHG